MAHIQTQYSKQWYPDSITNNKVSSQKIFIDNVIAMDNLLKNLIANSVDRYISFDALKAVDTSDTDIYTNYKMAFAFGQYGDGIYGGGIYIFARTMPEHAPTTDILPGLILPTTGGGMWNLIFPVTMNEDMQSLQAIVDGMETNISDIFSIINDSKIQSVGDFTQALGNKSDKIGTGHDGDMLIADSDGNMISSGLTRSGGWNRYLVTAMISGGTDLNTIISDGVYYCYEEGIINQPSIYKGTLYVMSAFKQDIVSDTDTVKHGLQKYIQYDGVEYVRSFTIYEGTTTFAAWKSTGGMEFASVEEAITGIEESKVISPYTAKQITDNIKSIKELNDLSDISVWVGTVAQYDALPTHDSSTLYVVTDDMNQTTFALLDENGKLVESQKPTYTAGEVGARPATWIPTASDIGLGNVDNVKQYSADNPPPYPLTTIKVNGVEIATVEQAVDIPVPTIKVNGVAVSPVDNVINITMPVIYSSTADPTSSDGKDGDLWVVI